MRIIIQLAIGSALGASLAAGACSPSKPPAGSSASGTVAANDASSAAACSEAAATGKPQQVLGNEHLSDEELRDFYHLSEGSEIFPFAWLRALRDPKTNEKVFDHLDRYGFLTDDDPSNVDHLPVGMTEAETRDSALFGLEMFGFNCAACHVGQIQAEGKVVRIVGAPNLTDVHQFLADFGTDLGALISNPALLLAFLQDIHTGSESQALVANPSPAEHALVTSLPKLDALKAGSPASQELAARIQALFDAEKSDPPVPMGQGLVVQPPTSHADAGVAPKPVRAAPLPKLSPAVDHPALAAAKPKKRIGTSARFSAETPPATFHAFLGAPLAKALKPAAGAPTGLEKDIAPMANFSPADQSLGVAQFLAEFVDTLRLLEQRFEPLFGLSQIPETNPGAGRVDAFMTAHNVIFRRDPPLPMNAPVDYPRLWNLAQMGWLHWDGNTTSILQRNVGQALGVGAVFDPITFASTILIDNIHRLEEIAKKIDPPAWPFTPPDPNAVDAGAKIYRDRCAACHDSDDGGTVAARDIGTDPNRADSFAHARAGDAAFDDALEQALQHVIDRAFQDEDASDATRVAWETTSPVRWRNTDGYIERSLVGVWATAPYLHNGSVPTLDDLLSGSRPSSFWIGDRRLDVVRGGYCTTSGTFLFDAGADGAGNSNAGHSGHPYGTDLGTADRRALIAYLETLR